MDDGLRELCPRSYELENYKIPSQVTALRKDHFKLIFSPCVQDRSYLLGLRHSHCEFSLKQSRIENTPTCCDIAVFRITRLSDAPDGGLKTLSDPTGHVHSGTANYWRTPTISSVTFGELQ